MVLGLLLLDADEHLCEKIAFQILPRLAVFAYADGTMKQQSAEPAREILAPRQMGCSDACLPREVQTVPVVDLAMQVFGDTV